VKKGLEGVVAALLALGYAALALLLLISPLLWILKDGLGPKAVETTGWAAVVRFSPVLLLGLGIVGYLMLLHLGLWCLRRPAEGEGWPVSVRPRPEGREDAFQAAPPAHRP
jgi:hypothetical protein